MLLFKGDVAGDDGMKDLKDKYVLVAGGCGLIGRAIAKEFAGWGSLVHTLDIKGQPAFIHSVSHGNIFDLLALENVDVFVNAVYPGTYEDHAGWFSMPTYYAAEHMKEKGGSIINIASIYGIIGPTLSLYEDTDVTIPPIGYSAAKGAIIALSRSIATQYAKYDVRVNCVSPGGVFDNQDPKFVERYEAKTPMGRMATPEDIAGPVCFLASDAAKYITGTNLVIDGGLTAC